MSLTLPLWAAAAASLLLPASAIAQTPSMDALWPNEDGLAWTYAQHYENHSSPQVVDNRTRLRFDGAAVAPNGIEAQYLRQELIGSAPVAIAVAVESGLTDPFLQHLWIARPDLRQRIVEKAAGGSCPTSAPSGSYAVLLTGELAYRKTPDEIAAWRCNTVDTRSWLWLAADLTPGSEFTLQLVPDLAGDVFLHGTVAGVEAVTVPAGTFGSSVRVDYVIDYGRAECTDEFGNPTGSYRSETRGYIHYAPGVGPVQSYEEFIPVVEQTGNCGTGPVGERASLASMALESATTPARRSTWGQIKTAYR